MSWSFAIARTAAAALVLATLLPAQKAPKLGKPQRHGIGIVYALPKDWKVESGAEAVLFLPPGITIDPDREDNPEVILAELPEGLNGPEDPAIPDALKGRYAAEGAEPLREPLKEVFSTPGKPGAIYTLDFRKGSKNLRVRVFYVQAKGKLVSLTVSGETSRLTAREPALRASAASLDYAP